MQIGQAIGPFVIDKVLGSGAMGAVYRARYAKNNARVAVKVIGAGLMDNKNIRDRFEREARILKQLEHPNIVRFLGAGKSGGAPYYAMEYIEGESLDRVLERRRLDRDDEKQDDETLRGRFSWEDVVTIGQQLCDALQHAHEKGIIHRDLKPSNLMRLPDGTIKLTDFGIAKDTDATALTAANVTVGTASYMSPEQCRGDRDLTFKSDLYSLGIVFFELLTGRKPFTAETPLEMFMKHIKEEPEVRPARVVQDCPVWLDTLIMQMLEKDPDRRPRNAALIGESLGQISEKVQAQRSAGVEAVKGKRGRGKNAPELDEADKEAARALRGGKGKKKKKKAGTPIYKRPWFVIVGIAAVLMVLAGAVYVIVAGGIGNSISQVQGPPSLDELYNEAKPLIESGDIEEMRKARSGPLTRFEKHHADSADPKAEQMRAWIDQVTIAEAHTRLDRFVRSAIGKLAFKIEPSPGAETLATKAVVEETKNRTEDAIALWKELLAGNKPEGDTRGLYLMAEARVKAFERLDGEIKRLTDIARDRYDKLDRDRAVTDMEKQTVAALELELQGKPDEARDAWTRIKENVENDPSQRLWYYMAVKKLKEVKPDKGG